MNRRDFLRFGGGAVIASATMAEAGMLAEFLSWLKRKPVWSFPSEFPFKYADLSAITVNYIVPRLTDEVFRPSPAFGFLAKEYAGGFKIRIPFSIQGEL